MSNVCPVHSEFKRNIKIKLEISNLTKLLSSASHEILNEVLILSILLDLQFPQFFTVLKSISLYLKKNYSRNCNCN